MINRSFKRIFIVGCARSGTTLLQSMLAAHPRLTSYPETHFWDYTIPKKWWFRYPKIYTQKHQQLVSNYLTDHGFPLCSMSNMDPIYFNTKSWSRALMSVLDQLTGDEYMGWIEKTPRHLYCIPFIQVADPNAHFVHIVRPGRDVVASLYQVSRDYPEHWNGGKTIDKCIEKWRNAIQLSHKYLDDTNHSFVDYEDLIANKEPLIRKLCGVLEINFSPPMISDFSEEAKQLVSENEYWKEANIRGRNSTNKFSSIFTEEEQEYIIEQTQDISLEIFRNQEEI